MSVQELIAELTRMPRDEEVLIWDDGWLRPPQLRSRTLYRDNDGDIHEAGANTHPDQFQALVVE